MADDLQKKIEIGARWIFESKKIVIFTGAGISTESGIPDYRGPDGVSTRRDKGLPPPKWKVPQNQVKPNDGHNCIVELQNMGKLSLLISQNVDGLHIDSGIKLDIIAELHGNNNFRK